MQNENSLTAEPNDVRALWKQLFLQRIFRSELERRQYWIIDALDESNSGSGNELVSLLQALPLGYSVFITSRKDQNLERELRRLDMRVTSHHIDQSETLNDIRAYLEHNSDDLHVDDEVEAEILINQLIEKSKGSFLWTTLIVQELSNYWTDDDIKMVIDTVPDGLHDPYSRILRQLSRSLNSELAKSILQWVTCATHPMSVAELRTAIRLDTGRTLKNPGQAMESICSPLVTVTNDRVEVIHDTVREYLLNKNRLRGSEEVEGFTFDKGATQERLARICLTFMTETFGASQRRTGSRNPFEKDDEAFLSYAIKTPEAMKCLQFAHGRDWLVASGRGVFAMYNYETGENIWTTGTADEILTLSINANDSTISCVTRAKAVCSFDARTGDTLQSRQLERSKTIGRSPLQVHISDELGLVALVYRNEALELYDFNTLRRPRGKIGFSANIDAVAFNPPLEMVAIGSFDGQLCTYDISTMKQANSISADVAHMAVAGNGITLGVGTKLGDIYIYDFENLSVLIKIKHEEEDILGLHFASNGLRILDIRRQRLNVWQPAALVRRKEDDDSSHSDGKSTFSTAPSQLVEASTSTDGVPLTVLAELHVGNFILCGRDDGAVVVYDTLRGRPKQKLFSFGRTPVLSMAWNGIRGLLATADNSSTVKVHHVRMDQERGPVGLKVTWAVQLVFQKSLQHPIRQLLFSREGELLLVSTTGREYVFPTAGGPAVLVHECNPFPSAPQLSSSSLPTGPPKRSQKWALHPRDPCQFLEIQRSSSKARASHGSSHIISWERDDPNKPTISSAAVQWAEQNAYEMQYRHAHLAHAAGSGHAHGSASAPAPAVQPCFAVYDNNPSSAPFVWPQLSASEEAVKHTFEVLDNVLSQIDTILGMYRTRLVFTSVDGWVCSCRLDEERVDEGVRPPALASKLRDLDAPPAASACVPSAVAPTHAVTVVTVALSALRSWAAQALDTVSDLIRPTPTAQLPRPSLNGQLNGQLIRLIQPIHHALTTALSTLSTLFTLATPCTASDSEAPDRIHVIHMDRTFTIDFPPYAINEEKVTVRELRRRVAERIGTTADRVRLIYKRREVKRNECSLRRYRMKQNSEVSAIVTERPSNYEQVRDRDSASDSGSDSGSGANRAVQTNGNGFLSPTGHVPSSTPVDRRPREAFRASEAQHHDSQRASSRGPDYRDSQRASSRGPDYRDSQRASSRGPDYRDSDHRRGREPSQSRGPSAARAPSTGLISTMNTVWLPLCTRFILSPPSDPEARRKEYLKLSESVMQLVDKADAIDLEGNAEARSVRKELINGAHEVVKKLDAQVRVPIS
ncbi:hypothetical protein DV737_g5208, partial [Chaetothyriales sp. CBS 132003]